jgi:hypothetical protein
LNKLFSAALSSAFLLGLAACSGGASPVAPSSDDAQRVNVRPALAALGSIYVSAAFSPKTFVNGDGSSILTVTMSDNFVPLSGLSVSVPVPTGNYAGLYAEAVWPATTTCGGTITMGATAVTLVGGSIAANSSCTISIPVLSYHAGDYIVTIPAGGAKAQQVLSAPSNQASAGVTVTAPVVIPQA